jgi:hypothetical protein
LYWHKKVEKSRLAACICILAAMEQEWDIPMSQQAMRAQQPPHNFEESDSDDENNLPGTQPLPEDQQERAASGAEAGPGPGSIPRYAEMLHICSYAKGLNVLLPP